MFMYFTTDKYSDNIIWFGFNEQGKIFFRKCADCMLANNGISTGKNKKENINGKRNDYV